MSFWTESVRHGRVRKNIFIDYNSDTPPGYEDIRIQYGNKILESFTIDKSLSLDEAKAKRDMIHNRYLYLADQLKKLSDYNKMKFKEACND